MDDLDSWMRSYINKHRLKFLENLNTYTELFTEGFPNLQENQKSKISCRLRQEGYLAANSLLLDNITRIDNYPVLFIEFCRDRNCTYELMRIVQTGIDEYYRLTRYSHNPAGKHRNRHLQSSFPPTHTLERDLGSAEFEEQCPVSFEHRKFDNKSQEATNWVDRTSSDNADNNVVENRNRTAVVYGGTEESKCNSKSGENAAFLLNMLENINVFDNKTSEGVIEQSQFSKVVDDNVENDRVVEDECAVVGLENVCGNTGRHFSNDGLGIRCACPAHANVGSDDNNYRRESQALRCEREMPDSSSDIENLQRNENNFQICDPNNMDRNDPVKNTSGGNKMKIASENVTNDENQTSDNRNKKTLLNYAGNREKIDKRIDGSLAEIEGTSFQNRTLVQKSDNSGRSEAETSGSYYLTSSDEEEFLPVYIPGFDEIENLKEITSPSVNSDDLVQRSDSTENELSSQQTTIPKEIESSRALDANFILLSTGMSGTQCQEDIENSISKRNPTERIEHDALSDVSKGSEGTNFSESSVSKIIATEDSHISEENNKSAYIGTHISVNQSTDTQSVVMKDIISNPEQMDSSNITAAQNVNESSNYLSESATSLTTLKQGQIRNNRTVESITQQSKFTDCHPVAFNLHKTVVQITAEVDRPPDNFEESSSISLLCSSSSISVNSAKSQGFEVYDLSETSELDISDSELIIVKDSLPLHGTENCLSAVGSETCNSELCIGEESNVEDGESLDTFNAENNISSTLKYSEAQPQTNNTENVLILPISYQNGIDSDHNNGLLESNPENDCIDGINNNNFTPVNEIIQNTRSSKICNFYIFIRDIFQTSFPELGIRI